MARLTYLISYDIADDAARARAAAAIQAFGNRIQRSVYLANLDLCRDLDELGDYLQSIINTDFDTVRISPQCQSCLEATRTLGQADLMPPPIAWIVL